jgi:predicted 3-demethylubiquinone-9 3-methyltransferase (glyoxalase superfamily)
MSTISRITPCLWYDGAAEEAAKLYTSLFPDSHIDDVMRSASDNPSVSEGAVLVVRFTLAGQALLALNGGPQFKFTEAVSLQIDCADQSEVDHYWEGLVAGGGEHGQCGWLKDRFGLAHAAGAAGDDRDLPTQLAHSPIPRPERGTTQ